MFVRTAAQHLAGRAGTGAVSSSPHSAGHLDGRAHSGPGHPGGAHPDSGQDSHAAAGPGRRAEQVGGLQHGLRVLTGLHAQGGHAGCAVTLTTVGRQEGQAHGVGDAAGAQTVSWEIKKEGPIVIVFTNTILILQDD